MSEIGPPCKCGDPRCVVTRRRRDGSWCDYASRRCVGRMVGALYQGVSAATLNGHGKWRTERWQKNHADVVKALQKFKRGEVELGAMVESLVIVETRAYQRGHVVGRRLGRQDAQRDEVRVSRG